MEDFHLTIRTLGGTSVVDCNGTIDAYASPYLKEEINKLLETGNTVIIINLMEVEYIDDTALGICLGGYQKAKAKKGDLLIVAIGTVRRCFEVTGLDRFFRVFDSVDDAVASIQGEKSYVPAQCR